METKTGRNEKRRYRSVAETIWDTINRECGVLAEQPELAVDIIEQSLEGVVGSAINIRDRVLSKYRATHNKLRKEMAELEAELKVEN